MPIVNERREMAVGKFAFQKRGIFEMPRFDR